MTSSLKSPPVEARQGQETTIASPLLAGPRAMNATLEGKEVYRRAQIQATGHHILYLNRNTALQAVQNGGFWPKTGLRQLNSQAQEKRLTLSPPVVTIAS